MCDSIGCEARATHSVWLCVPAADGSGSARGEMGIALCALHSKEVPTWDFESIAWALEPLMRQLGFLEANVELAYAEALPIREEVMN